SNSQVLMKAIRLLTVACVACGSSRESLVGEWSGEDHTGARIQMRFAKNRSFEIVSPTQNLSPPAGVRLEYSELAEVTPKQLYLKLFKNGELVEKIPFAIYKFEAGKLVLCQTKEFRSTLGGIPIGQSRYEFPTEFTGGCFALERK